MTRRSVLYPHHWRQVGQGEDKEGSEDRSEDRLWMELQTSIAMIMQGNG